MGAVKSSKKGRTRALAGPISGGKALEHLSRAVEKYAQKVRAAGGSVKSTALCFDIDDTLLLWRGEDAVVNEPAHSLYHRARDLGYQIFVVTARTKSAGNMRYSLEQLRVLGYDLEAIPTGGLYLMPKAYFNSGEVGEFKRDARKHIESKYGVQILAMVGDQWTDLFAKGDDHEIALGLDDDHHAYVIAQPDETHAIGVKLESFD